MNEAGEEVHPPLSEANIIPAPPVKTTKRGDCFGGSVSISCPGKVNYNYQCGCGSVDFTFVVEGVDVLTIVD